MTLKLFLLIILAGFAGLLAFATVYKYVEVRIASRWPSVPGRVLSSRVVQRRAGGVGGDEKDVELRNFAEVTYEYEVQGRKQRANRVSIGEDPGNFQVEETLAKYPQGASVRVYYNPTKHGEAVLERDVPEGAFKFMFWLVFGLVAVGLTLIFGTEQLIGYLKMVLPAGRNVSLAVMLGFMGLFALLIALASSREAKNTQNWKSTWGRIESSGVEKFQTLSESSGGGQRWQTMQRAQVIYTYNVNGHEYRGDKVAEGWKSSASFGYFARRAAAKFAEGEPVEVFYDPANPSRALLDRRLKGGGFTYLIAFALLAAAAKVAGLF
jgi:hypothetical protein